MRVVWDNKSRAYFQKNAKITLKAHIKLRSLFTSILSKLWWDLVETVLDMIEKCTFRCILTYERFSSKLSCGKIAKSGLIHCFPNFSSNSWMSLAHCLSSRKKRSLKASSTVYRWSCFTTKQCWWKVNRAFKAFFVWQETDTENGRAEKVLFP